jgi:hypothetical protein
MGTAEAPKARPKQWQGNTITVIPAPGKPRIEVSSKDAMRRIA